jgi:beta-glucosidase
MITYIKHFVLNDQETNRTGISTFCNQQAFREVYLRGFEYGFTVGGSNAVMGSFNRIGCTWTGAHKGLMTNLLTNEWGFNGITDTDFALWSHMEARRGVMAGTTDFAVTTDARANELLASMMTDADLYAAVREACHRNLYVIANSAEMNGFTSDMRIITVLTPYQVALIATTVVFGVLFLASGALLVLYTYKKED